MKFTFIALSVFLASCASSPQPKPEENQVTFVPPSTDVPMNTFRFLGNALVCKFDNKSAYPCHRIGKMRVGDNFKPKTLAYKTIEQNDGSTSSVYPIIKDEKYEAYWVITHKNEIIKAVQLTGNYPHDDLTFSTIALGDSADKVRKILGPRYVVRPVPSINGVMWDYYPFAITIELIDDLVYSIRVQEEDAINRLNSSERRPSLV